MSKRKSRLAEGRGIRSQNSRKNGTAVAPKQETKQAVQINQGEKLGPRVTREERLLVEIHSLRLRLLERQKEINNLNVALGERDNTIFMYENGLKPGQTLRKNEKDEWYWILRDNGEFSAAEEEQVETEEADLSEPVEVAPGV